MIDTINFTDLDTIDKIEGLTEKLNARKQELEAQTLQRAKEAFLDILRASGIKSISRDEISELFSDIGPKPEQPAKEDTKRGKRKVVIRRYIKKDGTVYDHAGGPRKDEDINALVKSGNSELIAAIRIAEQQEGTGSLPAPTQEQIEAAKDAWNAFDRVKKEPSKGIPEKGPAKPVRTKAPKS